MNKAFILIKGFATHKEKKHSMKFQQLWDYKDGKLKIH